MKPLVLFLFLAALLTAQSAPDIEITAEPHHRQIFANDQVRVFIAELPPHAETLMHWHRHDYIYVTLGDSQVQNTVKGKDPVTVKLKDGQTGFLPGNFAHIARNLSDQPFRIVNVELLQDAKLRQSSAHWDPTHPENDRGLDILQGGTKEILFVKDGVRVSEIELQPNAAVPAQSPSHPLLLVAINDLDLYTTDPRTHGSHEHPPAATHLHAGDTKWLVHGLGRPLVNAGSHNAKFITLEFH